MPRSRRPHNRPDRTYADHRLGPGPRKRLWRAHHLMESGRHRHAALIFEQVAQATFDRKNLNRAPALFLQTGRAYLLAGRQDVSMHWLWRGLRLLADTGRWSALERVGNRLTDELQQLGDADLAAEIETWLQSTLPEHTSQTDRPALRAHQSVLPLKCSFCGGVLRPDEVEWSNEQTAECAYCGSAIRAES